MKEMQKGYVAQFAEIHFTSRIFISVEIVLEDCLEDRKGNNLKPVLRVGRTKRPIPSLGAKSTLKIKILHRSPHPSVVLVQSPFIPQSGCLWVSGSSPMLV